MFSDQVAGLAQTSSVCVSMVSSIKDTELPQIIFNSSSAPVMMALFFQQAKMLLGLLKIHFNRPAQHIQFQDVCSCQGCIGT